MDASPELAGTQEPARLATTERRIPAKLTGGGPDGNEQITTITGTILLIMLAVLGVTIVRIGQLRWLHLFVGLLLIGPVVLKLASTGYRFARYYTGNASYRRKGPPVMQLRLIGPIVVLTTVVVFVSGVVLLFVGPVDRGQFVLIHKASFFVWLAFTTLHVLGHLPHMPRTLRAVARPQPDLPGLQSGAAGRWLSIAGALLGGLVLAVVLIPDFAIWTAHIALLHHHDHGH